MAQVEGEDASAVVQALRRLFRAIQEHSKAIHKQTRLTGPQIWALRLLAERPGVSLGELSARLYSHPSTVSGVVDRLVERGAVSRVPDPEDRRGIRLSLTALGQKLVETSPPPVQQPLVDALHAMKPARLRALRAALEEIARRTEADRLDAPFFDVGPTSSTQRRPAGRARGARVSRAR